MVYRVVQQEPLEEKEIECNSDVLVVGAGVSGSIATLTLAEQKDRRVYLLEKAPCIGGLVARFEEVSPTLECAPCMMASILEEVLDKDNITILTNSEITDVKGSVGNFHVKIDKKARYVSLENCIGCGECYEPCPVSVKNEFDEGLSDRKAIYVPFAGSLPNVPIIDTENCLNFKDEGQAQSCELCKDSCGFDAIDFNDKGEELDIKVGGVIISTGARYFEPEQKQRFENVYTNMEFERIISQTGPTQGEIRLATGKAPSSVAIIHCVGRDKLGYCSRVCCSASLRYSHTIKNKLPEANVYEIYTDFVVPGKREQGFYKEVEQKGVEFIRREENSIPEISTRGDLLNVSFEDAKGEQRKLDVDLVILSCGIIPSEDNRAIAELFDIECDDKGFFKEDHMKIRDYMTATEGIFIAGTAQWPKSIEESIAQSIASCGKILAKLVPGEKMPIETKTAEIDEELCSGCKICISLCPYKAISFDEEKDVCVVDEALCKGCGTCSASCPSKISKNKHFTTEQIFAEIKGVIA
jgi:heterodisulfide reductase subunit A